MKKTKKDNDKYAWTVKIGERGQFVIPKEAREMFNMKPGDTIILLADKQRGIAIPPQSMFTEVAKAVFKTESEDEVENK